MTLNRRDFLKWSGAALSSAVLKPFPPDEDRPQATGLGRVTDWRIWAYHEPRPGARREVALTRDQVVTVLDTVSTEGLLAHNPVWNLTKYGWVYSSWVQPVARKINPAVKKMPPSGFWAEVSVPFTDLRAAPRDAAALLYRLYYSSVHLVVGWVADVDGVVWYQLKDDQYEGRLEYVRAKALRPISPEELTPLSPGVKDKRLEVNIKEQRLYAYEGDRVVYTARCATGAAFTIEGGVVDFTTPQGEHTVVRKRPSRHMTGFLGRADEYDLPGVPYCTYFT
ncbi:MAG TPA: L,D-transpeptidase, partial [Anaerolineae bacterium]|nr:L,D-transpeptidase [Anaerolineae bacterium]